MTYKQACNRWALRCLAGLSAISLLLIGFLPKIGGGVAIVLFLLSLVIFLIFLFHYPSRLFREAFIQENKLTGELPRLWSVKTPWETAATVLGVPVSKISREFMLLELRYRRWYAARR